MPNQSTSKSTNDSDAQEQDARRLVEVLRRERDEERLARVNAAAEMAQQIQQLQEQLRRLQESTSNEESNLAPPPNAPAATADDNSQPPAWVTQLASALRGGDQSKSRITFKEEADTLIKFTGTDEMMPVLTWVEQVEELAAMSGWNGYETFFAAKRALTGAAKDWLICRRDIADWSTLRTHLIETFKSRVDEHRTLELLRRERPKKDETLQEYAHRMRRLGSQGRVSDNLVRRFIADGIPDDPFRKASLYAAKDYEELREALALYETVKAAARESTHQGPRRNETSSAKPSTSTSQSNHGGARAAERTANDKCFNCAKFGHHGRDCPEKKEGMKCFYFHVPGHRISECPKKRGGSTSTQTPRSPNDVKEMNLIGELGSDRTHKVATIEGVEVKAMLDSGAKINTLRADQWRAIDRATRKTHQVKEYVGTLIGFGGAVTRPEGRVTLSTQIDGSVYELDYVIVPEHTSREGVLIGDPLRNLARIILEPNQAIVESLLGAEYVNFVANEQSGKELAIQSVSIEQREKVRNIIENYHPEVKQEAPVEMKIIVKDETPIRRLPRRLAPR